MPAIRLFGYLRDYAGGGRFEIPGRTAGELLAGLCAGNTRLHSAIFEGEQISRHVRIILNGRDVELVQGLATPVAADEVLSVFPPIAGG